MFFAKGPKEQIRLPTTSAYGPIWHGNQAVTSSDYDTYYVGYRAFDRNTGEPAWVSDEADVLGIANGINNILGIYGEYLMLQLPSNIFITSRIYEGSRPSRWHLFGWNLDSEYVEIHHQDTALTDTDWENATDLTMTFNVNPTEKFIQYILLITHVTNASTHAGLCELYFMGSDDYSGEENLEMGDHLETKMIYQ